MTAEIDNRNEVAVLGTGRMGAPIARNLLAAGLSVTVWNRTAARAQALVDDGAQAAETPAAAAGGAEVLITMLSDGPATDRALSGPDGALSTLRPGSIWVQMGTIGLDWTEQLAELAREHGVAFVDAPVSGSDGPARDGKLVILASGDDRLRERLEPIFGVLGRRTMWLGPAGSGSALKLVLNGWLASITEAAAESVALATALGLDPRVFVDTLADLPLASPYALTKADAMIAGSFTPGFALKWAQKDVELAAFAASQRDLSLPVLESVDARWGEVVAAGAGEEDVASVVKGLRPGRAPLAAAGVREETARS
jgi:3-hydroxyisobutyrate dehydrogenase